MKYDVFISCKSEDYNLGRQVYEFLVNHRDLNLNVFMADKELRKLGVSDYGKAIDDALESSMHLIVVSSNVNYLKYETSPYVYYEWHAFTEDIKSGRKNGNIMTIFTADVDLKNVPIALRSRQSFPFAEYSSIIDYLKVSEDVQPDNPTVKTIIQESIKEKQDLIEIDNDLDYEDALVFIENGELKNAIQSLQISFEGGNGNTVSLFNKILFQNYGNIDWDEETWKFLEKQAEMGHSFAHLAFFYKFLHNRETYPQAWKHVRLARSDRKNGYAVLCEGIAYENGIGTDPKLTIATNRYKSAFQMEVWESCSYLANMYLSGNSGLNADNNEAMIVLSEGQKHDDARSWYVLGTIYGKDAYIKENWEKAVEAYKKAVELHMYEAWINLGNLYNYNRFSEDYKDEALSCYLEALKNGNKDAHAYIAKQYWEKDRQEDAIIEAQKGEKVRNVLSISTLGKFYEEGLQEEGHWIKELKPDYPKAWNYYREAFQLGGNIKDAISMARLYVKEEYRPEDISWEIIEGYLEEGAKVPIIEALELMIEVLKKNGKEEEILKYLEIGADSGSLSMKHEYGIRLLSTDNGKALLLIEEAGEKGFQPSVEWLIHYYRKPQTYSKKDYEKWMEIGADMGIDVPLEDYLLYLSEKNPEKAKDYLLSKYSGNEIKYFVWIYKFHRVLEFDKQWLLSEFKSNYSKSEGELSELCEPYADFMLRNGLMDDFEAFHNDISTINPDEGLYFSLLKEVFEEKELKKELAIRIKDFSIDKSIRSNIRARTRNLLQNYLADKHGSKILIADGIMSNALLLKILFTNEGYNVSTVNSGEMCIDSAKKDLPDIILMDALLPDIDGFDVADRLKSIPETRNIPIIFLTKLNNPADMVHAFQAGASDFLSKPFNKEELFCRTTHQLIMSKLIKLAFDYPNNTGKKKKILIVDDVISNVRLIKILLNNEKIDVCTANDGDTCIESAEKENPDLILLDVMMPKLNGFDATALLKKNPKTWNIPILFLTALNNPQDLIHGFQLGADDFLSKPFNKEELLMRIKNILTVNEMITKFLTE